MEGHELGAVAHVPRPLGQDVFMRSLPEPSTSQVKKAGQTLRRHLRGERQPREPVALAIATVEAFRAAHSSPLNAANMGLRSMVRSEGCSVEVSQRLKRMVTIINKLTREPTLPLSSMQDIGGVRVILSSTEEIRRVESRLRKRRPVVGSSDYITGPRSSGYRGVHVIVKYGNRNIEVQLRTHVMHEWAVTVERLGSRVGANFKQDGSSPVQQLMSVISEAMATEERGERVSLDLLSRLNELRSAAAPFLAESRGPS